MILGIESIGLVQRGGNRPQVTRRLRTHRDFGQKRRQVPELSAVVVSDRLATTTVIPEGP